MRRVLSTLFLALCLAAGGFAAGLNGPGEVLAASPEAAVAGPFVQDFFGAEAAFVYIVQRGDTLYGLAMRFGVNADAIASANGLRGLRLLYVGQRLVIPSATPSPAPAPAPTTSNKLIKISINQQRMWIYQGGGLVKTYVISTGVRGRDTSPGNFRVQSKIPEAWASLWALRMPYWMGIYNVGAYENGIHALPINRYGQVLWSGLLGRPASFGCVIMATDQARELYNWAPIGTPVQIVY